MSYRNLLKRYITHVVAHTGTPWIDLVRPSEFLSRQDLLELRVLYTESLSDRQTSAIASKDFNVSAREECAQKGLDSSELALHLEWPERVVRRWLLDPNDPDYRAMSERDYQHFLFCISQLPASSDEINNKSGQT